MCKNMCECAKFCMCEKCVHAGVAAGVCLQKKGGNMCGCAKFCMSALVQDVCTVLAGMATRFFLQKNCGNVCVSAN